MPCKIQAQGNLRTRKGAVNDRVFQDFILFNRNGFMEIVYFLWRNIWMVAGVLSIGYIFLAEQLSTKNNEVKNERQIL